MSNSGHTSDHTLGHTLDPSDQLIEHVLVSSHSRSSNRSSPKSNRSSPKSNRSSPKSNRSSPRSNRSSPRSNRSSPKSNRSSPRSSNGPMEECEKFIEVLTDVLEQPDNIDASIYCAVSEEIEEECDDFYVYINVYNKNTDELCAYVKYMPSEKVIHVESVIRCSDEILPEQGSGTDIVRNIIAVGDEFRKHLAPGSSLSIMIDSDQSILTIKENEFDLGWLYIFATGET